MVVHVKKRSRESSRMNLLIVSHALSVKDSNVNSGIAGAQKGAIHTKQDH